jgi:ribonucleoside-triphosphate reductase
MSEWLPTAFQQYIAVSKYARWLPKENRRETWEETVNRYMMNVVQDKIRTLANAESLYEEICQAILNLEVMPSMRAMMTAGPALDRDHMAAYNCSFIAVDNPRAFDEALYILTCGTGLGFSCESRFVNKMPEVAEEFHESDSTIVVSDSRIGWASSFRELVQLLYGGKIPKIDTSKVRKKGERLATFGGRASGPEPLVDLFNYVVRTFRSAAGRKLSDIEVHGIMCKIGEIVVSGGVRRSALISLSDLNSDRMRHAKSGNWLVSSPEFTLANNSAVYDSKPSTGEMLEEWEALYRSKSGERGIYNRQGIRRKTESIGRRDADSIVGTNPCGEIALRSAGLCNLTEIVVRAGDTLADLKRKARIATILGTIQSTFTDFRYVRSIWKRNAEEERLLGVSLTGIYDNPLLSRPSGTVGETSGISGSEGNLRQILEELKEYCGQVNREFAEKLGINPSVAISTVKPSGTVSQLVNSAPGIHPRHSQYYIRSVRQDNKDPLTQFLKDQGVVWEPCAIRPESTTVFFFPVASEGEVTTREQVNPISHLELWKVYNEHWAEHQVSITVSIKEDEWMRVGAWVYDNFDELSGVSFLPYADHTYAQAPFEAVSKQKYEELLAKTPATLDWAQLRNYELEDSTTSARELACTAGACEVL